MSTPSVIYREGALTIADYDEAIEALNEARTDLEFPPVDDFGCAVCGSEEHKPADCRHNPLVMARRAAARADLWKCYHCGATFGVDQLLLARQHFGLAYSSMPECVAKILKAIGVGFELTTDDEGNAAFVFSVKEERMFFAVNVDETDAAKRGQANVLYQQFVSLLRANHIGGATSEIVAIEE